MRSTSFALLVRSLLIFQLCPSFVAMFLFLRFLACRTRFYIGCGTESQRNCSLTKESLRIFRILRRELHMSRTSQAERIVFQKINGMNWISCPLQTGVIGC